MTVTTPDIRIVVVDDHRLFREGLIEILRSLDGLEVLAEGSSSAEALALAQQFEPDVVVLDIEMPGPPVHAIIQQILLASPRTRIVVLTMFDDPTLIRTLIDAGASSYLLKSAERIELGAAIQQAARRDDTVLLAVSRTCVADLINPSVNSSVTFTPREMAILGHLGKGHTNRAIGLQLHISEGTVKRQLTSIYSKLGATSRVDAIRKAIASEVIGVEPH